MGFLKFLKKGNQKAGSVNIDELDMPPAPPGSKPNIRTDLGKLPELPDIPDLHEDPNANKQMPESSFDDPMKEMEQPPKQQLEDPLQSPPTKGQDFSFSDTPEQDTFEMPPGEMGIDDMTQDEKMPVDEAAYHTEPTAPQEHEEKQDVEPVQKPPKQDSGFYGKVAKEAVTDQRNVLQHKREIDGPIYIRIDRFKHVIGNLNDIRTNIKHANDSIQTLYDLEENKDKSYEKWRSTMDDLQKKLLFIEQTTFKR